jgi:hypothetical protein
MNTFKYEPSKYPPSQCGVCRTRMTEGEEACFISSQQPSQTAPGKESFIMSMCHAECARHEGYRPSESSPTTWMRTSNKTTRRVIRPE